jgi:predicted dehydrogenase
MSKIKLIHVGLGGWGSAWARDVLPRHPDIEVAAYVDKDEAALARAQAALSISPDICFRDLAAALAGVRSDAVAICLPVPLHAPVAARALAADKHVVVEKPFTATLREAHELVRLAGERRRVLMASQNYRYFPAPILAAALVREHGLGRLGQVKVDFRRNSMTRPHAYPELAHPLLVDMAVHHYDLARMILGEDPVEVTCRSWNPVGSPFAGDASGALTLTFPGGATLSYRGSWVDQARETSWAGEWQLDFERGSVLFTSRSGRPNWRAQERLWIKPLGGEPEPQHLPAVRLHGRRGVLAAFAAAIRTGAEPSAAFPSGRDNLGTLAVIEASLASAASGGKPVRIADILAQGESAAKGTEKPGPLKLGLRG